MRLDLHALGRGTVCTLGGRFENLFHHSTILGETDVHKVFVVVVVAAHGWDVLWSVGFKGSLLFV